jgi:hypothetical protein
MLVSGNYILGLLFTVADPDITTWRGQIENKKIRGGKLKKIKI